MSLLAELFEDGRIVDLILALVALEAVLLMVIFGRCNIGGAARRWLANLFSGASLLLAVRLALTGAAWYWVAACLLASLVAHVIDMIFRYRDFSPPSR